MNIQIEFGVKLENARSAREFFRCVGDVRRGGTHS